MPGVMRRLRSGGRVLITTCDACGVVGAPFGFYLSGQLGRWYCAAHRAQGEAWLAEQQQRRIDNLEAL